MKKFILGLGLLFVSSFASAQGVNGSYLRITPTSLPTLCRLGDVRVDSVSGGLNLCGAANNWALLASGSSVPALTTLGDTLYEDATPAAVRLPGNTTTTKKFLSQTGTGTISAAPAWAQPVCADLSNATASCSTDTTNASNISSGTLGAARLPNPSASTLGGVQSYAAVSNQWINSISTSGVPSSTQPAFSNISGTIAASQLPNPSASTLGGVQSAAPVSNQWINSISTSGVPALSQPAFSNISGTASLTTQVTGTLPIANGGTNNGSLGVVAGSMYYADGSKLLSMGAGTSGQVPISTGTTVTWGTPQGGLIGQRELIPNTNIEVNATGYNAYADAAGVQPVDGTGGSPNTTCARTTTTPITGVGSLLITKSGSANRQGEGCSIDTSTLSTADKYPIIAQVEFDYSVASGTFTAGSDLPGSSVDSDYEVYIYDVANSNIIAPYPKKLYSNVGGHFSTIFQTATNATTYRLIFHNATTTTNNFSLEIDNVSIHPATPSGLGSLDYDPVAYTPTFSAAWGTVTNVSFFQERRGKLLHVYGTFTVGTRAASIATMSLPTGLSIDTAAVASNTSANPGQIIGRYQSSEAAANSGGNVVTAAGTSTTLVYFATASTNAGSHITPANGDAVTASSVGGSVEFWVPIANWSNGNGATSGAGVVVGSRAHVSSGSATTAGNAVNFDTIDYDLTNSISTGATTWKYTAPYPGVYAVCVNYYFGVGAVNGGIYKNGSLYSGVQNSDSDPGAGCDNIKLVAGDTIMFSPVNATGTPSALTGVSVAQANYIDIFLVQGAVPASGIPLPTVSSQATTYAATVGDYIYASGASYTITLPTAVGVKGREITIEHAGTSLSQVYTLNTTSSQTIGGIASGSYALYTSGEVLNLISDGSNWRIKNHKADTAEVSYTPTFTGFGTVASVNSYWMRRGSIMHIRIGVVAGTVAPSTATMTLPGSMTTAASIYGSQNAIVGHWNRNTAGAESGSVIVTAASSNTVGFSVANGTGADPTVPVNGNSILGNGNLMTGDYEISVTGWQP